MRAVIGIDRKIKRKDRRAKYLDGCVEWCCVEHQRTRIIVPLITCLIITAAKRTPCATLFANSERRADVTLRQ